MSAALEATPVPTGAPTLMEGTCVGAREASSGLDKVTASQAQDSQGSSLKEMKKTVCRQRPATSVRLMAELRMADTSATLTAMGSVRSLW